MENGFHSRSLHSENAPDNRPAVRPTPVRSYEPARRRGAGGGKIAALKDRIVRIYAWAKARGWKRLLRDAVVWGGGFGVLYFLFLWLTLPNIGDPRSLIASQSSVIVDRNGTELYRLYREEDRTFVPEDMVPEHMRQAIVAIEDQRFYERGCLDIRAIARVFFRLGQAGGASTLTRQLARNALDLKGDNIINRKLKELILGCQLEATYSKEELLNLYLNWIPFGQSAYGIEQASRTYFNVSAKDLSLAQSVVLAALPQRPSYFSPYGSHVRTAATEQGLQKILDGRIQNARDIEDGDVSIGLVGDYLGTGSTLVYVGGRTDQVLENMEELGMLTAEEKAAALTELQTIEFKPYRENIRAPHFVLWVKQQVEEMLAENAEEGLLNQGGLTIETTLDWEMQQAAESLIAAKRDDIGRVYEAYNMALVSAEVGTNNILAYVGNANFDDDEHDGKVDMARAARQPGSSFKPFVYAAAFEEGFGPGTVLFDVPTKIGEDEPQNFDGGFWGLMNARRALGASRNIPAIKAFFLAGGEDGVLELASRMGAVTPTVQRREFQESNPDFEYGWPLALGAGETPPLEMVQAYATFANNGVYKPLNSIVRIKDRRGNIIYEADTDTDGSQVLDSGIAYEITSILSDTAARPNEFWQSVLNVPGFQTAAKTGTSNECLKRDDNGNCTDRKPSDLWTMGYTPNIVTGIWIGNANSDPLAASAESLNLASPIWKDYMVRAHKLLENPATTFAMPDGIVQPQISTLSGQLPTECTPVSHRKSDIFLAENAPSQADPSCVTVEIDRVTGLLASDECPAEARETRSFFAPKEVLSERFPQWQQAVIAWAQSQMQSYDPVTGSFSGGTLPLPLVPTEECRISMTPGRTEQPELQIEYPTNGGSATHPSFQPRLDYSVGSSVREIRATIDGKSAGTATSLPFTVTVPRSVSESGRHTLAITLVDEYYNEVTDTVDFTFEEDLNEPSVLFVSPRGDIIARSGETLTLEADAEDAEGGIKYVQFYLDTRLLSTKPTAPYKLEWPQDLNPGNYELRAVATDLAGNEAEDTVELKIE